MRFLHAIKASMYHSSHENTFLQTHVPVQYFSKYLPVLVVWFQLFSITSFLIPVLFQESCLIPIFSQYSFSDSCFFQYPFSDSSYCCASRRILEPELGDRTAQSWAVAFQLVQIQHHSTLVRLVPFHLTFFSFNWGYLTCYVDAFDSLMMKEVMRGCGVVFLECFDGA